MDVSERWRGLSDGEAWTYTDDCDVLDGHFFFNIYLFAFDASRSVKILMEIEWILLMCVTFKELFSDCSLDVFVC